MDLFILKKKSHSLVKMPNLRRVKDYCLGFLPLIGIGPLKREREEIWGEIGDDWESILQPLNQELFPLYMGA